MPTALANSEGHPLGDVGEQGTKAPPHTTGWDDATGSHTSFYELQVSDHRGSNSQVIDFESVKIYPIFTVKIENPGKSNT